MAKILIVEDDAAILNSYAFVLGKLGHEVTPVSSAKAALLALKNEQFAAILLDMLMPEMSGLEFLKQAGLKVNSPQTKVLVVSNTESAKIREQALALGASDYALKVENTPHQIADKIAKLLS